MTRPPEPSNGDWDNAPGIVSAWAQWLEDRVDAHIDMVRVQAAEIARLKAEVSALQGPLWREILANEGCHNQPQCPSPDKCECDEKYQRIVNFAATLEPQP